VVEKINHHQSPLPPMNPYLETFQQFRQALYTSFPQRRDSVMELIDALSGNERARSPVEVSLHPLFQRQYSALYKAIATAYQESELPLCNLLAQQQGQMILEQVIPTAGAQQYTVFGIDETANERLYARCLSDRQHIHRSTVVPGQLPISVGHNYSMMSVMPPAENDSWSHWSLPFNVQRVSSVESAITVAHQQVAELYRAPIAAQIPLKVLTVDSRYPTPEFLSGLVSYPDLVVIARVRRNRVFYQLPQPGNHPTRPRWYGERFDLRDEHTWSAPEAETTLHLTTGKGHPLTLHLRRWTSLLMRGTRQFRMHQSPFDLLQVQALDETGQPQGQSLWLLVWGAQRHQLCLSDIRHAYSQRFNLEHYLGFAKPHLLLTASQTCHTAHEINWFRLACLAYVQLWLARHLVNVLPLPWQRYLPQHRTRLPLTPRSLQRGFTQLIQQIGSIARPTKPRGISTGRPTGTRLPPRSRCPTVKFHPSRRRCRCKKAKNAA
jgi:hypothetical protein